jgi:hypothetical protein
VELLDDATAARAALATMNDDPDYRRYPVTDHLANWAAHFDAPEAAVAALRRGDQPQPLRFLWVWTPLWQKVRPHPLFKDFIRERA